MDAIRERNEESLPTIYSSYRPVEEYLEHLERVGCLCEPPAFAPVDALAFSLLLSLLPEPATLVNEGAGVDYGIATVLCRSQRRVAQLIEKTSRHGNSADHNWSSALRDYLDSIEQLAPRVLDDCSTSIEIENARLPVHRLVGRGMLVVLLAGSADNVDETCRNAMEWLDRNPEALVVLIGVGQTGACPLLRSLSLRFGEHSTQRLILVREQAAAFHESRLAVLCRRNNSQVDDVLLRLRLFFTGNLSYLNLAKGAFEQAVNTAAARRQTLDRQVESLDEAFQIIAQLEHDLAAMNGSLALRFARRLGRLRQLLAPEGTLRFVVFRGLVQSVRILAFEGVRGLRFRVTRRFPA